MEVGGHAASAVPSARRRRMDLFAMWNRALLSIVALACAMAVGPRASAAFITVELYPLTGEIRLSNTGLNAVPIVFYSIFSPSGALNSSAAVWKSISENYDASGNQVVDAVNNWNTLSPIGSTTELSEGVIADPGGSLPPTRSISLGRVWDAGKVPFPDLQFDFREPNEQQIGTAIEYTLDGDFSGNGSVDLFDYSFYWRPTFGSTTNLIADANLNGVVDAADYTVWRNNLFTTAPKPPFGAAAGSLTANLAAVPEPAAGVLLPILSSVGLGRLAMRRRGRRRQNRRLQRPVPPAQVLQTACWLRRLQTPVKIAAAYLVPVIGRVKRHLFSRGQTSTA